MKQELWNYWISPKALSLMIEEGCAMYPKETGGIVIGWQQKRIFYIEIASGPGPNAFHKGISFQRDGNFAQTNLDSIVEETHGNWDYLGEWHSHPRNTGPSSIDINSLKRIQTDSKFNILNPIMGLLVKERSMWHFHCYILTPNKRITEISLVENAVE